MTERERLKAFSPMSISRINKIVADETMTATEVVLLCWCSIVEIKEERKLKVRFGLFRF